MKRLFIWSLLIGLWANVAVTLAQNSESVELIGNDSLTLVPTRAVEPLQILVSAKGEEGYFSGEILSRRPLSASVLSFSLLNQDEGVVWSERIKLPEKAQRIMPFYFPSIAANGELFLSVQAYDDFGNTAGSGHQYITFPTQEPSVEISSVSTFLTDQATLNIALFAENGTVRQTYIPQIKIYRGLEHFGELERIDPQDPVTLDPRQRQQLEFDIPFDLPPGVYEVVVTLLDAGTREPLSASFYRQIFLSGDYFKVIDLQTYYTNQERSKARIELSGLSTVVLSEPVKMQVKMQHQQNIFLDKTFNLALQPGYFTKNIDLSLPAYVRQLSGTATFSLQGRVLKVVEFSSEAIDTEAVAEEPEPEPLKIDRVVLQEGSKWVFSQAQILQVVIVCSVILGLLVLISWVRGRFFVWAIVMIGGSLCTWTAVKALTIGRDVFPMVEWSNPIPQSSMIFNPTSDNGFQWLPVKGRVFNYLTQTALIKREGFEQMRLNLVSPSKRTYQLVMEESFLKEGTTLYANPRSGDYYFVLDLRKVAQASVVGQSSPLVWEDGEWRLQLVFPYVQKDNPTIWLATPLETFGTFRIDQQPPLWKWQLLNSVDGLLAEADFTNQPITLETQCQDKGSGCMQPSQSFAVAGNFCADATKCNTKAVRTVRLCDKADNCTDQEMIIHHYDPVPPQVEKFLIGSSDTVKASESMLLSLRYRDPNRVSLEETSIELDQELCGEKNPYFRLDVAAGVCVQRAQTCVLESAHNLWRGLAYDGVCAPQCPEGYQFKEGSCQIVCGDAGFDQDRLCLPFNLKVSNEA